MAFESDGGISIFLKRVGGVHTLTTFTWMGWFNLTTDKNAVTILFYANNNSDTQWIGFDTASDGTTLCIDTQTAQVQSGVSVKTGQWFHAALTKDGSSFKLYYNGAQILRVTDTAANNLITDLYMGSLNGSFTLQGRAEGIKIWQGVALTPREIQREMRQHAPIRKGEIWNATPLYAAASYGDLSGRNHPWTGGNPPTQVSGPGIPWLRKPLARELFASEPAAGGGPVSTTVVGVTATAAAAANAGTIAAQVSTTIAGATATATASAPAGTVAAVQIAAPAGATATAPADALAGTVAAVQIAAPAGETATAAAAANAATIAAQVTDTIAGATATAPADALAGTVAAVQIAAPAGATATAGADALAGTVNTGVPVTVAGETATAAAAAGAGTVAALQTVSVAGETATSAADAGSGAILIARTVPGETATAAAAGLAATIAAQVGAQVAGERATATAAGLAAVLATVQIAAVSGAAAAALAAALAGTFVSNVETGGAGFAPQKATVSIRRLPAARAKLVP